MQISELRNEMSYCKLLKKDSAVRVGDVIGSTHRQTQFSPSFAVALTAK